MKSTFAELSPSTQRAYLRDRAAFLTWCRSIKLPWERAKPADIVRYLRGLKSDGLAFQTIERRRAGIHHFYRAVKMEPPTGGAAVDECIQALRKELPQRVVDKSPISLKTLAKMLNGCDNSLIGLRDRAILTVQFEYALKRSAVCALTVADVPTFKPFSRAAALVWVKASRLKDGPLFRPVTKGGDVQASCLSGTSINNIIKSYAAAVGVGRVSCHSMRRGRISTTFDPAPLKEVMSLAGYALPRSVLDAVR